MRNDAEAWKHSDVNFGLGEKPEEALPENGQALLDERRRLRSQKAPRGKEARAEQTVGEKEDAGSEQDAENQQTEDGVEEPSPDGEGQARESHAFGANVDGGDAEVERGKERGEAEKRDARDPERDARFGANEKGGCDSEK